MNKFNWESLIGMQIGRLNVVGPCGKDRYGNPKFRCICECGNEVITLGTKLNQGLKLSCGCLQKEKAKACMTTHGKTKTRIYNIWNAMIQRCNNPNAISYKRYGGRGISVCDEWKDHFENFLEWSMANGYRDNLSIDRIDNNGNYNPDNCRWATVSEQANNTRRSRIITYNGITKTAKEWADYFGFNYKYFHEKLKKSDWSIETVLNIPYFKEQLCS